MRRCICCNDRLPAVHRTARRNRSASICNRCLEAGDRIDRPIAGLIVVCELCSKTEVADPTDYPAGDGPPCMHFCNECLDTCYMRCRATPRKERNQHDHSVSQALDQ